MQRRDVARSRVTNESGFAVELALPWATVQAAGVDRNRLILNIQNEGAPR